MTSEPVRQPQSFDAAANDYDTFRLPYPPEVVGTLVAAAGIGAGSRVLEIACGTGQLSVDLAARGCDLTAVEMGPNLARLARRNLSRFPTARVEVARFETWPLPRDRFDSVVCATAFHWLDPDVRFTKSADALRPGGTLAVLHVHHVRGGTPGFFEDTQPCYRRWGLSDDPNFQPPDASALPPMYPEPERMSAFASVARHRVELPSLRSTADYVGLLRTDSLVLTLSPERRRGFLRDIAHIIDSRYGGQVARNFVYEVIGATRV